MKAPVIAFVSIGLANFTPAEVIGDPPHPFAASQPADETPPDQLLLKDYRPRSIYKIPVTAITKARFPIIDVHSHNYADNGEQVKEWIRTMDAKGVERTVVLTQSTGRRFDEIAAKYRAYPDRFSIWCGFDFSGVDQPGYGPAAVAELERCATNGAQGIGELVDKGAGLMGVSNGSPLIGKGNWVKNLHIDDSRLDPLLERCADLGMPVSIHVGGSITGYEKMDRYNDGLMHAFKWRLDDQTDILNHAELIATLERAAKKHPRTVFVACHLATSEYDPALLGRLFDTYPNLYADLSARYAETAAIPRTMAGFYEKYSDRVLYGTDMGRDAAMYETTIRILETEDEHFYDWTLFLYHWPLHGLGLKDEVLKKIYADNARKLFPAGRQ